MIIENFFSLEKNPFMIHPSVEFYCRLTPHEEALNMIMYALCNHDSLIKITGDIGLGKSIVAGCLRDRLRSDNSYIVCEIRNPKLVPAELLESLIEQLNIAINDKSDEISSGSNEKMVKSIEQLLIQCKKKKRNAVLIIDEAQAIDDNLLETLRLLTNLEHGSQPLMQIVLFGQDELDEKLSQHKFRQIKQRICFSYRVRPLDSEEVARYVQHRLHIAGSNYKAIFTQQALARLAQYSKGVPRLINIVAHKAMLIAAGENNYQVTIKNVNFAAKQHGMKVFLLSQNISKSVYGLIALNAMLALLYLLRMYSIG